MSGFFKSIRKTKRSKIRITKWPEEDPVLRAAMNRYLNSRRLDPSLARINGWYPSRRAGDNEPRIVIPAINSLDYPYWQARAMIEGGMRYQSPRVARTDSVIEVVPMIPAVEWGPFVLFITEGPMDALALMQEGYRFNYPTKAIALMGDYPSDCVYEFLAERFEDSEIEKVVLFGDNDAPGEAAKIMARLMVYQTFDCDVVMIFPYPGCKDFAAMPNELRQKLFLEIIDET